MRRRNWIWPAVAAVVVAGCGITGGRAEQPAQPAPLSEPRQAGTPLAAWQAKTAETVTRLLAKQGDAVTVLQPSGQPRPAEALAAALTLHQAGKQTEAVTASVGKSGLFEADGFDPLFVSWLTIRSPQARFSRVAVARAAKQQMASQSALVVAGDAEAAGAYLIGHDLLELLSTPPPAPPKVPTACSRVAAAIKTKDLVSASTWSEIASASRQPCPKPVAEALADLAKERLGDREGVVGPYTAAEIWSGEKALKLAGRPATVPAICPALLAEQAAVRVVRDTMAYLACADAVESTGTLPHLSDDVISRLDLIVKTGGQLPDHQSLDAMGKLYETQTLRVLRFRSDLIAAARLGTTTANPADPTTKLVNAFTQGKPAPTDLPATASGGEVMLSAAAVLAGEPCPQRADQKFAAARAEPGTDADSLLRVAVVLKARERCTHPVAGADAAVLQELAAAEGALGNDLIGWWKAEEARCLLAGRSDLSSEALLRMLPDYSLTNPRFDLSLDTLYASVRLSEIVDSGCGRPFWDIHS